MSKSHIRVSVRLKGIVVGLIGGLLVGLFVWFVRSDPMQVLAGAIAGALIGALMKRRRQLEVPGDGVNTQRHSKFQFSIVDLFILVTLVAVLLAWLVQRPVAFGLAVSIPAAVIVVSLAGSTLGSVIRAFTVKVGRPPYAAIIGRSALFAAIGGSISLLIGMVVKFLAEQFGWRLPLPWGDVRSETIGLDVMVLTAVVAFLSAVLLTVYSRGRAPAAAKN